MNVRPSILWTYVHGKTPRKIRDFMPGQRCFGVFENCVFAQKASAVVFFCILGDYWKIKKKVKPAIFYHYVSDAFVNMKCPYIFAVRHVDTICKNEGISIMTSRKCRSCIITHVLGNAHYRQARVGIEMLEYFKSEEALLTDNMSIN